MEIGLTRLTRNSIITFLRDHLHTTILNESLQTKDDKVFRSKRNFWTPAHRYSEALYGRDTGAGIVDLHRYGGINDGIEFDESHQLDGTHEIHGDTGFDEFLNFLFGVDLSAVSTDEYRLDYKSGVVTFNEVQPKGVPILADYSYNWADFQDAWPDVELRRPVVAVEMGPIRESPLELGGGVIVTGIARLNVFAMSVAQRDDISDAIRVALNRGSIPLIDFNSESMLNEDGTYNTSFDPVQQNLRRISIQLPEIHPNPTGSDEISERSRALIEFRYKVVDY